MAVKINVVEDISRVIHNSEKIRIMQVNLQDNQVYIVKHVLSETMIERMKKYLMNIGKNSLPNYEPIVEGAPNFHRLNFWDERAYVKGCFHQFVFYPWNQDVFNLFDEMKEAYYLKNLTSNLPKEKYLNSISEDGCTARIAFQFYPSGGGSLNRHRDPVDYHQLTVPIVIMSEKGRHFDTGGAFVEDEDGNKLNIDDIAEVGDVVYFNAKMVHGVDAIDSKEELDWLAFKGRWIMLLSVNKLAGNNAIRNAVDLAKNKDLTIEGQ